MPKVEFLEKLAKILDTDPGRLTESTAVDPIHWDSIEVLGAIELIDRAGQAVKIADILSCESIGDVLRLAGYESDRTEAR